MPTKSKMKPVAKKNEGLVSDGNKMFEIGVSQGMKTFDQLITISTFAIGFLLLVKSEVALTSRQESYVFVSATFFFLGIAMAIARNYLSGYGLVYRGKKLIFEGLGEKKKSDVFDLKAEEIEWRREMFSWLTRCCFFTGLLLVLILLAGIR